MSAAAKEHGSVGAKFGTVVHAKPGELERRARTEARQQRVVLCEWPGTSTENSDSGFRSKYGNAMSPDGAAQRAAIVLEFDAV